MLYILWFLVNHGTNSDESVAMVSFTSHITSYIEYLSNRLFINNL